MVGTVFHVKSKIKRVLCFAMVLLFALNCVMLSVSAVDSDLQETYILVTKSQEALDIIEKFGNSETNGDATDTEIDESGESGETAESFNLDDYLTIKVSGTKTVRETAETEGDEENAGNSEYKVMVFNIQGSKPTSEWPDKLKKLRAIAEKSSKGEFTARIAEEADASATKIGYLVRSTFDCTGCFYMDKENNLWVYITPLSEDDAKGYLDSENEESEHKTMEGQVDLRELSSEELAQLTKIRDELALEHDNAIDTTLIKVADVILNIFGIICIAYGVVMLFAYVFDMYNVLNTEIEFFNLVTFGRWHIADFADGGIINGSMRFMKIPRLIFTVVIVVLIGVLLLVVDWVTLAVTIYTYLRERGV